MASRKDSVRDQDEDPAVVVLSCGEWAALVPVDPKEKDREVREYLRGQLYAVAVGAVIVLLVAAAALLLSKAA